MKTLVYSFILIAVIISVGIVFLRSSDRVSTADAAALSSLNFARFPPGNYNCTVARSDFESSFNGTMLVSDGKARIDFTVGSHVIADNGIAYMWQEGKKQGIKGPAATAFSESPGSVASRTVICKKVSSVDPSIFVLPENVQF